MIVEEGCIIDMSGNTENPNPPLIPDHQLSRRVDKGSYGEVWLGQSVMGTFRAIKVIYRDSFDDLRPFEREFRGIQKFEPISHEHDGLVSIFHIGRSSDGSYFYYVMEVADNLDGTPIVPEKYTPRTLKNVLLARGRLPVKECVQIGLGLTRSLGHLHANGLVHRDIKPSNIIFVRGAVKFADIGLVTAIGDKATFVGTAGYIPAEGPGHPTADIFSLGKVIYQMAMGKDVTQFPELPTTLEGEPELNELLALNDIILRACGPRPVERYQNAGEMQAALERLGQAPSARGPTPANEPAATTQANSTTVPASPPSARPPPSGHRVALLYKAHVEPDEYLVSVITHELGALGYDVFFDRRLAIGVDWARQIEAEIRSSHAVIVLLSPASVQSEMIAYEVEIAHQAAQQNPGHPRLLPIRLQLAKPLTGALASHLDPLHYFLWRSPQDDKLLIEELARALEMTEGFSGPVPPARLESIGGAVPLDSQFYVVRPTDHEFKSAVARRDSIVLVKGARQMGKTSLLARGLQQARAAGDRVVLTDFQKLNSSHLSSVKAFYLSLEEFLAEQLDLETYPAKVWDDRRGPNTNFERFLRREILAKSPSHFVWGLDEVDRLFACDFGSEVFGLFRSWHNERALDPTGPWSRLTLAIAYATEAHLFITDVNQSPFNVGTRLTLADFTPDQVADLNQRYGSPLRTKAELDAFYLLLGGQPYLVRRALNEMASGPLTFSQWNAHSDRDEGIFGDHLRRILVLLAKDAALCQVVRGILREQTSPDATSFYRLRSAGLVTGETPSEVQMRSQIYATYLRRHLL